MAPIIRLFTLIFGQTELGVRAGATVCALVISLFIYLLAKRLFGPVTALCFGGSCQRASPIRRRVGDYDPGPGADRLLGCRLVCRLIGR